MIAAGYSEFGAAQDVLGLRETETPAPGPGEVLVEVAMSGVNPSDVKARAGTRPGVTRPPFPFIIPHSDGAGIIVAAGANVDPARVGERVWVWNGQWGRASGTCATHICLPSHQAVALPASSSFETGAQLGIPGLTATHCVFAGGDIAGKSVLIQGASGTVGYLATQMAVWGGAKVIATARGDARARLVDAGANSVVDFTSSTLSRDILEAASGPVDHIVEVEFGQNAHTLSEVIAENGSVAAYGSALNMNPQIPFYSMMFKAVTLHMVLIYLLPPEQRTAAISRLNKALADNALDCPVQAVVPLKDSARAHALVEAGGRSGAILVQPA